VQHIMALSRSAVTIRHWFEINLDDASMEHGARIEIRELPPQPHRGSESASQLTTVDRPLWRADLFDRLAPGPGPGGTLAGALLTAGETTRWLSPSIFPNGRRLCLSSRERCGRGCAVPDVDH